MVVIEVAEAGRAAAEALMEDACAITRGAPKTFNTTTGAYAQGSGTPVYTGKCRVRMPNVAEASAEFAGLDVTTQTVIVSVPVSATGIKVGDAVTITAAQDAELVDRVFRVMGLHFQTHSSARRLRCEVVS